MNLFIDILYWGSAGLLLSMLTLIGLAARSMRLREEQLSRDVNQSLKDRVE